MGARALYVLDCGSREMNWPTLLTLTRMGQTFIDTFNAYLIDTDDGLVLVDTGLNPEAAGDPVAIAGEFGRHGRFFLTEQDDVRARLREIGVEPRDVRYLVLSHLHWDRAGACRFFTESTFVVQRSEYRYALYPDSYFSSGYIPGLFQGLSNLDLREGDGEVVPGVWVLHTPGHTPGHQSVVLSLPETGKVVLACDAVPTRANVELGVPGGRVWSATIALDTMNRLVQLGQREGALMLYGHEPDCWKTVRRSPESYR